MGGDASVWSIAVHWVFWLWGILVSTGQGQPLSVFYPRATRHELQSDVQMAATCAGLGGAQQRPSCEPRLTVVSAWPVATKQEIQSLLSPDASCLRDFRKI